MLAWYSILMLMILLDKYVDYFLTRDGSNFHFLFFSFTVSPSASFYFGIFVCQLREQLLEIAF
jgi:hypothetical protein